MSVNVELKLNPFDHLYHTLSYFSKPQAEYNVLDIFGEHTDRNPKIRVQHLLDRTGVPAAPADKLQRPIQVFTDFTTAYSTFRQTVSNLITNAAFANEFPGVVKSISLSANDKAATSAELLALEKKLKETRERAEAGLMSVKLAQSALKHSEFSALPWMKQLETTKDRRFAESVDAVTAYTATLNGMVQPGCGARIRYRTDTEFHKHGAHLDDERGYSGDERYMCKCAVINDMTAWLWASWSNTVPNIEGRGPSQSFCNFIPRDAWLFPRSYSEEPEVMYSGFYLTKEPKDYSRASWDATAKKLKWGKQVDDNSSGINLYSFGYRYKLQQCSNALAFEWGTQQVISEQWKFAQRALPYLQRVEEIRTLCVEPLNRLVEALTELTFLAIDMHDALSEIPVLLATTGHDFAFKSLQDEVPVKLDRVRSIWSNLTSDANSKQTLVQNKPFGNSIEFMKAYALRVVSEDKPPFHSIYPPTQKSPGPVLRAVPFPYPRQASAVLVGVQTLDLGTDKGINFELSAANLTSNGFDADIGPSLDQDGTTCYSLDMSWMDIPKSSFDNMYCSGQISALESAGTFRNGVAKSLPLQDSMKGGDGKIRPAVKTAAWFAGLRTEKGHQINFGLTVSSDASTINVKAYNDTALGFCKINYVQWDDSKTTVVCKTLTFIGTNFTKVPDTKSNTLFSEQRIEFDGKFKERPKFFRAITRVNADEKENVRLSSSVTELDESHAVVRVQTWDGSKIHEVQFVCIAIPDSGELF